MKNFTYYRPTTPEQAVALLAGKWGKTELLAGGTDLLDLQKEYIAQPDKLVSLRDIKPLIGIEVTKNEITIGAGTTLAEIAEHAELRKLKPAITTPAGDVGGPQIRNLGTLGGNLCQRNRCWYFRDEHVPCLLKGGRKCYATDGDNRYHAIFTISHPCVIVHPSTLAPGLIALGATANVLGPQGKRTIPIANFFQAPKSENDREHVLKPNEILLSVSMNAHPYKNASYEVRHKQAYDWPLAQAACSFEIKDGKAVDVRIVLGHVGPTPILSKPAAEALLNKPITEETSTAAGKAATEGAKPLSQNGYKVHLAQVAVKRAILTAAGMKKYWEV